MAAMTCIAATIFELHRRPRILISHLGIAALAIVVGLAGAAVTPVFLVVTLTALCAAQLCLAMSYNLQPANRPVIRTVVVNSEITSLTR